MKCSVHHLAVQYLLSPTTHCQTLSIWSLLIRNDGTILLHQYIFYQLSCNLGSSDVIMKVSYFYSKFLFDTRKVWSEEFCAIISFTEFFIFTFIWVIKVDSKYTDHWVDHYLDNGILMPTHTGQWGRAHHAVQKYHGEMRIANNFSFCWNEDVRSNEVFWPSGRLGSSTVEMTSIKSINNINCRNKNRKQNCCYNPPNKTL